MRRAFLALLVMFSVLVDSANCDAHQSLAKAAKEFGERRSRGEAVELRWLRVAQQAGSSVPPTRR
ncbi:MAG TPA: hypothetical protein VFR34_16480 [Paracoccaceae bacterium]|nr:hypothetical protein [Paracoccaceae bacterium]